MLNNVLLSIRKIQYTFLWQRITSNWVFLVMILVSGVTMLMPKNKLEALIVSQPDSSIELLLDNTVAEQTWAPYSKNITGISLPYKTETNFEGTMFLKLLSDNGSCLAESSVYKVFVAGEEGEIFFELGKTKVMPGVRYRIQLSGEMLQEGSIIVPVAEEYSGFSINGEEQGAAIGLKVFFEKNSTFAWLIATFLPFLVIALFLAVLCDRSLEDTLGISFIGAILCLFLFGLIGYLESGIYAIWIIAAVLFVALVYLCNKKQKSIMTLVTPGIIMWGVIMLISMYACKDLNRRLWDEYSHWGLAVKDMFYYNTYATHIGSTVWIPRYPPFATLIEYFFVYVNGIFSEGFMYVAYVALTYAVLLIPIKKGGKYGILRAGIYLLDCILIPIVYYGNIYLLYVDFMLAALTAYVLMCYFGEEESAFNYFRIVGGLIALVLTKDMGLVLALMIAGIITLDIMWKNRKSLKELCWNSLRGILCIIVAGGSFVIWQLYVNNPTKLKVVLITLLIIFVIGFVFITCFKKVSDKKKFMRNTVCTAVVFGIIGGIFVACYLATKVIGTEELGASGASVVASSGITFDGIFQLFTGGAPEYRYNVLREFVKRLFVGETFIAGSKKISVVTLLIFLYVCVIYFGKKTSTKKTAGRLKRFAILSAVVLVGYSVFLLVTYLFSFSIAEAERLASFSRYMGSCIFGILIAFVGLVIAEGGNASEYHVVDKIMLLMVLPLILSGSLKPFYNPQNEVGMAVGIQEYEEISEYLSTFCDREDSIYYINSNQSGVPYMIFRNQACPVKVSEIHDCDIYATEELVQAEKDILTSQGISAEGVFSVRTAEVWAEELKNYDYVFIHKPSNVLAQSYGELFEQPEKIGEKTVYRVVENGADVRLVYMGSVG